jgi:hypothetical protein
MIGLLPIIAELNYVIGKLAAFKLGAGLSAVFCDSLTPPPSRLSSVSRARSRFHGRDRGRRRRQFVKWVEVHPHDAISVVRRAHVGAGCSRAEVHTSAGD